MPADTTDADFRMRGAGVLSLKMQSPRGPTSGRLSTADRARVPPGAPTPHAIIELSRRQR
jgi:hypothetical protein